MHAEDVDLSALADAVGTPFYCYSSATLARHFEVFRAALGDLDALVCYAVKANSNQAVLTTLARLGAGMDVVSEGELRRALAAGTPPGRITFSGVGKTRAEMAFALEAGIFCFNVESEPELRALSEVAQAMGRTAPVALRVNPDIDARTHAKIRPARPRTNSASRSAARAPSLPRPRVCPASGSSASTSISARRSPIFRLSTTPSASPPNSSRSCAPTATTSPMSTSAAASASPIAKARIRTAITRTAMRKSSAPGSADSGRASFSSRGG